jgi:beta-lactam-binding protein with PASTA domain
LAGLNLKVGKVTYEANDAFPAGTVFKQSCATCEGTSVKPGDLIDLWVVGGEDQ